MFSLRTDVWILLGLLAAVILLGMAGNLLAAEGFEPLLTDIQLPLQILFLGLVLALALAFVPVMVKLVIGFQLRAGNGDLALVKSVAARQKMVIWALWILMLAGLAAALPAMIRDGFFSAGAAGAGCLGAVGAFSSLLAAFGAAGAASGFIGFSGAGGVP